MHPAPNDESCLSSSLCLLLSGSIAVLFQLDTDTSHDPSLRQWSAPHPTKEGEIHAHTCLNCGHLLGLPHVQALTAGIPMMLGKSMISTADFFLL